MKTFSGGWWFIEVGTLSWFVYEKFDCNQKGFTWQQSFYCHSFHHEKFLLSLHHEKFLLSCLTLDQNCPCLLFYPLSLDFLLYMKTFYDPLEASTVHYIVVMHITKWRRRKGRRKNYFMVSIIIVFAIIVTSNKIRIYFLNVLRVLMENRFDVKV